MLEACCFCEGQFQPPLLSISGESNLGLKGCVLSDKILLSRSVSRL